MIVAVVALAIRIDVVAVTVSANGSMFFRVMPIKMKKLKKNFSLCLCSPTGLCKTTISYFMLTIKDKDGEMHQCSLCTTWTQREEEESRISVNLYDD